MSAGRRRATLAVAAWLLCIAVQARPAAGQFAFTNSTGQILAGQSSNASSSTTVASQGVVTLQGSPTSATARVGFNVNADAPPGQVAIEVGLASFELTFALDPPASFDLIVDFLLRGQLLRVQDEDCQGAVSLADVSIPTLVRLNDGKEFPLNVTLVGAALDFDGTTAQFNLSGQDSRTISFRDEQVDQTTVYRLTVLVSATALSQSCEVSARFGADNGSTMECGACEYPGSGDRIRDEDGLFVTVSFVSVCGDGTRDPGEQCDHGLMNGIDCCDTSCRFASSTQVCRPSAGDCDEVESCTGLSDICPEDGVKSDGSPCTDDRSPCTNDVCDASGQCVHPLRDGATCDDEGLCTCDNDGLFCNGLVRCNAGGFCIVLPPPCAEDDICDEERDICVSPFATPTSMPNGTITASPTPTATDVTPGAPTPTPSAPAAICAGDCDRDGMVAVNELVVGVNIALGNQPASACAAFDGDGDGSVAINELVAGVSNALAGCRI